MATGHDARVERHRIKDGKDWKLADHATHDSGGLTRAESERMLAAELERLGALQARLYAMRRWSVLMLFEGMDGAGKGEAIRRLANAMNPHGCHVASFQVPSEEELDHDFLWRCVLHLPRRGQVGLFDRSWYEEVVVVRIRQDLFVRQRLPERLVTKNIWKERHEDIVAFERHLERNGTRLLKVFLHVSLEEQQRRLLARAHEPTQSWNVTGDALDDRRHWAQYMSAYEEMVKITASEEAPWIVVPADDPAYAQLVVAAALVEAIESLEAGFPDSREQKRELKQVRRGLAQQPESTDR